MFDIIAESTPPAGGATIDLAAWEPVSDRTALPARPTPFTWSILAPTLSEAYRRTASQLHLPGLDRGTMLCLFEGRPYRRRHINLAAASENPGRSGLLAQWGLSNQGNKTTAATLAAASDQATRAGRWYDRVQQTRWGQADLLQVMEEIENLGNNVQAAWVQLAVTLRAAHGRVQQWQQEVWSDAAAQQVTDLVGHATAYEEVLASTSHEAAAVANLVSAYGHRGIDELELAAPRWIEMAPNAGWDWPAFIEPAWAGFAARQRTAEQSLASRTGFLKRRSLEADLQWRRRIAGLFDAMDDARARWLAGTRTWAVAAAHETVADGRIAQDGDIFLLELEEVKQLMTGEWNITHRESLQELVEQRRQEFARWA